MFLKADVCGKSNKFQRKLFAVRFHSDFYDSFQLPCLPSNSRPGWKCSPTMAVRSVENLRMDPGQTSLPCLFFWELI